MRDFLFRNMLVVHNRFPMLGRLFTFFYHNLLYIMNNLKTNKDTFNKNVMQGKELLEKYTKDNKYYYVLTNAGIGDTFIVASYAYTLKEKYDKEIAFLVFNSHMSIVKGYDYIKKIIGCTKEEYEKIFLYISTTKNYETPKYKYCFFQMKVSNNGVRNWASINLPNGMPLSEKYKKYVFDLDDSKEKYPLKIKATKNEVSKILRDNNIKENSILLIPYAYSTTNMGLEVWQELTKILKQRGYCVYTNIGNPKIEKCIKDTESINLPMDTMLKICNKFSYIISNRCGFGEYLAHNNPNMILIDEWEKHPCGWDDVNIYSSKKTIQYVYRDRKNVSKIVEDIIKKIGKEK